MVQELELLTIPPVQDGVLTGYYITPGKRGRTPVNFAGALDREAEVAEARFRPRLEIDQFLRSWTGTEREALCALPYDPRSEEVEDEFLRSGVEPTEPDKPAEPAKSEPPGALAPQFVAALQKGGSVGGLRKLGDPPP